MRLTSLNDLLDRNRKIDGSWKLGPRHEIQYRRRGGEQEVVLRGELLAAEPTGLTIRAAERSTEEAVISRLLTLRGRWEADAKNRLNFLVERQSDRNDRLALSGGWQVNNRNEIVYRFSRIHLKTKKSDTHTLTFRGAWDITDHHRLTYVLDRDSDSAFRFRGTWESASILAKEGQIRYQLGLEANGRRSVRVITLFGKWKLSRDWGLEFEIPYGNGMRQPLRFGATYALNSRNNLQATLTSAEGKPLGIELVFSRKFMKEGGQAFLRLHRSLENRGIEGGVRLRW